ncbi:MAG: TetR/AcrR family transcriptional regulator [Iamia sp.]
MAGRPQRVTDEEILDAVAMTISIVGPHRLTVAAVARRIGVTAPAIQQRFGSKHDLLVAFAARSAENAGLIFEEADGEAADPLDAVIEGLAEGASFRDRTELAHHLALLHLDLTDPQLGEHAVAHSRAVTAGVRARLVAARGAGTLSPAVSVDDLTDAIYTSYNGALVTWAIDGTGPLTDWVRTRLGRTVEPHRRRE